MTSSHLLRPFNASQLGLAVGGSDVVVFASAGDRRLGPSGLVHLPTLLGRLASLGAGISTLVFVDELLPDGALLGRVDDMLLVYPDLGTAALAQWVPATEALKVVADGRIERGIDRSGTVAVRCPEVVDRAALTRALDTTTATMWVNPTAEIARAGGRVTLFEPSMLPVWLQSL